VSGLALLLFVAALETPGPSAGVSASTLAVLPFKNLNADPALDWLKLGVAETMINDLKSARRGVVERDQIDRALAELALQKEALTDESRAARAGRLVGATHVVLGGFQRAAKQVRITARLVVVETGVVETSAKVTGDLEDIFGLQDAIVGQLLKLPDPKRRPKPKRPKKTLEAYQAYSLSLSTASDADKVEGLRRALDLDPDFHYALTELRALESRLNRYARRGQEIVDERTRQMLAVFDDEKAEVDERNMQAVQAMTGLMGQYRYEALLEVATRVAQAKLPAGKYVNAREHAGYYVFLSLMMLKRRDLALQAGERHLQQYPGGVYANGLDLQMRSMIEQAHRHEAAVKRAARELEELAFEERQAEKDAQKRGESLSRARIRTFSFRRCSVLVSGERWGEAIEACKAFSADYQAADDADNLVKLARWLTARAFSELGRFDEANAEALRLLDDFPSWSRENSLEMQRKTWPQP
jgi:TolB-like protein